MGTEYRRVCVCLCICAYVCMCMHMCARSCVYALACVAQNDLPGERLVSVPDFSTSHWYQAFVSVPASVPAVFSGLGLAKTVYIRYTVYIWYFWD